MKLTPGRGLLRGGGPGPLSGAQVGPVGLLGPPLYSALDRTGCKLLTIILFQYFTGIKYMYPNLGYIKFSRCTGGFFLQKLCSTFIQIKQKITYYYCNAR